MGKIKRAFVSDKYGVPLNQKGSGRATNILNNFSGEKKYERIVLNIEVEFDNGEKSYIVLKIANLDSDETIYYSDEYDNYLDSRLTPENSLSNKYLHESIIYNFFLENREDPIIKKYVIKSLGSGTTTDGNINLLRKDGVFENVNIFNNPSINHIVQYNRWNYPSLNSYVYIATEFNPNSISLDDGLEFYLKSQNYQDRKAEQKRKNISFVNSTIQTLRYLNQTFGFCHWDFHAGNIRYCRKTGNLELFDFDLSTINYEKTINNTLVNVKNSHYIHYIPFIYFLVKQIQKKYSFLQNEKGYYIAKNKLAHYLDIYQFIRYLIIIDRLNDSREYNDSAFIQTIVDIDNWSRNLNILNDYLRDNWHSYSRLNINNFVKEGLDYFKQVYNSTINEEIIHNITSYLECVHHVKSKTGSDPNWDYLKQTFAAYMILILIQDSMGNEGPLSIKVQSEPKIKKIEKEQKTRIDIGSLYEKNIRKCFKRPKDGGYPIAELRTIAEQIGVDKDKLTTRKVICTELHKILNIEKIVQEKKEKKLKVWKCEDYITNKGKKCPNCCSHHKDTCKWVRGKGCKTK